MPNPSTARKVTKPRTRLQKEQRKVYREKLLQAAQDVFGKKSYSGTSIDEIAQTADVSRATFYRHFSSKIEIAAALTDRLVAKLHTAHDRLHEAEVIDEATLIDWIHANIALYRATAPLVRTVREAAAIEPEFFRDHTIESHQKAIQKIGQTLRAFHVASEGPEKNSEACIRAHLLMRQLDMFCYAVAIEKWTESTDVGCRVLAAQMRAFIDEFG